MQFKSEFFETAEDLVQAKNDAWANVKDRRDRLVTIRKFTNMLNTLTEEEAEERGITEITNHGLIHKDMQQNETQLTSMVTGTNALLDLVVDTDNPEQDLIDSQRVSAAINLGALHHKGVFANFWRKVAGEIVIAGGCPVTNPQRYGWLPSLRPDMFFPRETGLDSNGVTYAFDPIELGLKELKTYKASIKGEKGKFIDRSNVEALIEYLKKQIANKSTNLNDANSYRTVSKSVRGGQRTGRSVTIPAWWYYEVKTDEATQKQYVSATLFIDSISGVTTDKASEADGSTQVISYVDRAYESAEDWLHLVCIDSEIGGVKNMDTLTGIAEMVYPSGVEMEELLNAIIEGDKVRARPKFQVKEGADRTKLMKWNMMRDTFAPDNIEELVLKSNSNGLQTPLGLLSQNAAGLSQGSLSNGPGGGELRQQAVERQRNTAVFQSSRLGEAYNHMEAILSTVIYNILAGKVKPGCEGYDDIMWTREYLERYNIDYKKLATRKYGRFQYLRVRVKRSVGNGDRQQQLETSDWLMANMLNFAPGVRPRLLHIATVLRTQDPDAADELVKIPKNIISNQRVVAENEYDTIQRRAALGQSLPLNDDDIHQYQIPSHLVDMQAHVARHQIRPWDKLDVLTFAAMVEHTGEHLKVLLGNVATNEEGKMFLQDYQNIVQSAQAITQEVEDAQGTEQNSLSPKEQADMELKWSQLELEGRKVGIKVEDMHQLWKSRDTRGTLSKRQQYVKEINDDRRLKLDKERNEMQAAAAKAKPAKTKT